MKTSDFIFWICAFTAIFFAQNSNAGTVYIPMPEGAQLANGQGVHYRIPYSSDAFEAAYPNKYDVPTTKGRELVTYDHKMRPNVPKLGGALKRLVTKGLPLVGTAAAAYEFVCEVSEICTNPDTGVLEKKSSSEPVTPENPAETPSYYYYAQQSTVPYQAPTARGACTKFVQNNPAFATITFEEGGANGHGYCSSSRGPAFSVSVERAVGCAPGYFNEGIKCTKPIVYQYRPLTPTDWDTAEPQLSTPQAFEPLALAGEPMPVVPELLPKQIVADRTSTTVRDSTGTATGTENRVRYINIEPQPNTNPNSLTSPAKVTETVVTTVTNITNNTTNQTTTTYNSSPDEPVPEKEPEDIEIEFDTPEDEPPLEEYEPDVQLEQNSWGGGSCPAGPVMNTSKGSYIYPMQPACSFVSSARPIILLLAGLAALYIISGIKTE